MYLWHAQLPHILVPIHLGYAITVRRPGHFSSSRRALGRTQGDETHGAVYKEVYVGDISLSGVIRCQ